MDVIFTLTELKATASKFLTATKGATIFAFHGEMGAGKTTFIHELCLQLGTKDNISSPTFSIINQYKIADGCIYHIDLYRLKNEQEAINAGAEDCLYSGNSCFVEWPEKAAGIFPDTTLHVTINLIDTNTRKLSFNL